MLARQIIARLRTEQDDVDGVKLLLGLLSNHVSSHPSLIEEVLYCFPLIASLTIAACRASKYLL